MRTLPSGNCFSLSQSAFNTCLSRDSHIEVVGSAVEILGELRVLFTTQVDSFDQKCGLKNSHPLHPHAMHIPRLACGRTYHHLFFPSTYSYIPIMANVTDPLAAALHGTDPQNLMEYIVRQKIYDSRYWKEECFGLTAVNVLEKASKLTNVGASFGGNRQPTKFLSLTLKLLQLQPTDELVNEFIFQDDFKYVRALGAFYKRLTGRPADIYETLEPLYNDYCKLRYRDIEEWKLLHMDEFVHMLLTSDRVCGIALPRLANRKTLEEEGYLDGPRVSALSSVLNEELTAEEYLLQKVQEGSEAATILWESRQAQQRKKEAQREERVRHDNKNDGKRKGKEEEEVSSSRKRSKKDEGYGSLFKSSAKRPSGGIASSATEKPSDNKAPEEGSDEYWNEQRAKLGLKPLKK